MTQESNLDVSVIVKNFNNSQFLQRSLSAVLINKPKEVIVVDDGSTDDSVKEIKKFPVKLIENPKNLGPVKTCNIGANIACGKYLLFVDSDAEIDQNYISTLAKFLDENPKVEVVSGKVIEGDTGGRMWFNFGYDPLSIREFIAKIIHQNVLKHWNNSLIRRLFTFVSPPFTLNLIRADKPRGVDWVVEMGFMTRRDLFEKLGGLDENFFMYYEGPDYCRRVRQHGFEVWYTPEVVITHLGGHSHNPEKREKFMAESWRHYSKKYLPFKLF